MVMILALVLSARAASYSLSLVDCLQETFGLTPIEAMASRLPVVVSDWNGYRDTVVEGRTGYRVPKLIRSSLDGVKSSSFSSLALKTALDQVSAA